METKKGERKNEHPNTTNQTLSTETLKALTELRKAFLNLEAATEKHNSEGFTEWDELSTEYPFKQSYDELTIEVSEWVRHHQGTNGWRT